MLNRWVEDGLLDTLEGVGAGCIAFSPLAQGMLTDKYLHGPSGVPSGSRMARNSSLSKDLLTEIDTHAVDGGVDLWRSQATS